MATSDAALYSAWTQLLGWLQDEAHTRGLTLTKVADFPDYIYRMERAYDLPTTTMSVSLGHPSGSGLLAAVSPRHADLKGVSLRLMGSSKHWHLHAGAAGSFSGLLEGKRPFDRLRLSKLLDAMAQGGHQP